METSGPSSHSPRNRGTIALVRTHRAIQLRPYPMLVAVVINSTDHGLDGITRKPPGEKSIFPTPKKTMKFDGPPEWTIEIDHVQCEIIHFLGGQ